MIEIVSLADHPKHFNTFFNEIYAEFRWFFKDMAKEDVKKQYWIKRRSIFIALDKKLFIGCYSIQGCLIGEVYVNPKYRKTGIGRILIEDAKKRNWYCLKWELYTFSKQAGFYQNVGFRIASKTADGKYHMVCYNRSAFILLASIIISALLCVLFF